MEGFPRLPMDHSNGRSEPSIVRERRSRSPTGPATGGFHRTNLIRHRPAFSYGVSLNTPIRSLDRTRRDSASIMDSAPHRPAHRMVMTARSPSLRTVLTLILAFAAGGTAEPSRARRVLGKLSGHLYRTEERGIGMDVGYYTEPEGVSLYPAPNDSTVFDTSLTHRRTLGGEIFYVVERMESDEWAEVERSLIGGYRVEHDHHDSLVRGYVPPGISIGGDNFSYAQPVNGYDTVSISVIDYTRLHWAARCYMAGAAVAWPHLALGVDVNIRAAAIREENYDPFLPIVEGTEELHSDKYKKRREEIDAGVVLSPGIGFGRRVNATHVNAAFQLERELKRCGAISFSLADTTIALIAELLSRNDSYRLRDLVVTRRFKAELDSILLTDAAVVPEQLRCLSPFVPRNLVVHRSSPVLVGGDVMLQARQRVDGAVFREKTRFPYVAGGGETFERDGAALGHSAMLGVRARWGTLLTRNWSVSLAAEKRLFSSHDHLEWYRNGAVDWQRLMETDWSAETALWGGAWLRLNAGVEHVLCRLVVPREWPYRSFVGVEGFIEDYVGIEFSMAWYHGGENHDRSYPLWTSPFSPLRHGRIVRLGAVYTF